MGDRSRGGFRLAGALVLAGVLLAVVAVFAVRELGHWLTVADTIAPARAIVVLHGHHPFRAMEAGTLYGQAWAPEIWMTRTGDTEASVARRRLGLPPLQEEELNRAVLRRLGVPAAAIRVLEGAGNNTSAELKVVAAELARVSGSAVILVTSKPHTRRVRATWRAVAGDRPPAIVRYAADDPFHADRWWRYTPDALSVTREIFGLLRVWTGFPPRADDGE